MNPGRDEESARALADIDAIRRRVVNVVGHALRTPVTTIAGMATALSTVEDDDTRARLVEGLARNAERMEMLVDELLIAAGVLTALPVEDRAPVSVSDVVQSAWRDLGSTDPLTIDGDDQHVVAGAESLRRAMSFLLDNAVKYGDGTLRVAQTRVGGDVRVEIESSGSGPSDEELLHVFELLYRGEHAVMTAPGLGIGLAVARELVRTNGGEVTLERRGSSIVATMELSR